MKPTPPVRFDLVVSRGEPAVYSASCVVGAEPTAEEAEAAIIAVRDRVAAELAQRNDAPSSPPTLFQICPGKVWIVHLYAVGQYPAKEQ